MLVALCQNGLKDTEDFAVFLIDANWFPHFHSGEQGGVNFGTLSS